jgi:hypothetical protein
MSKTREQAALEYQSKMDFPLENLSIAMWGISDTSPQRLDDAEIVERAARKIIMLKKMVLAKGFSEEMLKIIMEE